MKYETFYHIHRSPFPSSLEYDIEIEPNNLENKSNQTQLFFSSFDTFWHQTVRDTGSKSYGGYRAYKIDIPSSMFTTSTDISSPAKKIFKVTPENKAWYIKMSKKYYRGGFFPEHFLGVDATDFWYSGHRPAYTNEGVLFNIKKSKAVITLVEIVITNPNYLNKIPINKLINPDDAGGFKKEEMEQLIKDYPLINEPILEVSFKVEIPIYN